MFRYDLIKNLFDRLTLLLYYEDFKRDLKPILGLAYIKYTLLEKQLWILDKQNIKRVKCLKKPIKPSKIYFIES